ncbi:hypothetical protein [Dongia sedimenti]|uniref:Uncharacterized protein n=1 Tax=Dongia sedimenti TaxID=3064282 RepID=A0ABU0YVG2_9PROT|nr:hypothetical protein [Rhodospirillaceae bacterium R-7]
MTLPDLARLTNIRRLAAVAFALVLTTFANSSARTDGFDTSVTEESRFYRLNASYMHGDNKVDFDIVVGCSIRVTTYMGNGSSVDVDRFPGNYTIATADGGALMQLVPEACDGSTTSNGKIPKDLLPGILWFESKDDLSLGTGYLSEAAFENPRSRLKFLGASIEPATRADWEAFRPKLAQSLIDPAAFTGNGTVPTETEVKANLWNKAKLAQWTRNSMECYGFARYHIEGQDSHKFLDRLRPKDKPRFWTVRDDDAMEFGAYFVRPDSKNIPGRLNGHFMEDYRRGFGPKAAAGFPTRAQGGMILSHVYGRMASDLFPMKADDGVPWARPEAGQETTTLYRDLDYAGGENRGFAYCYSFYAGWGPVGALHLPGYGHRKKITRIDGVEVEPDPNAHLPGAVPVWIVEDTDYLYISFHYNIH